MNDSDYQDAGEEYGRHGGANHYIIDLRAWA